MNILLVYPEFPDTFWSFRHALKFINKKINNPPLGLMTVSSLLPKTWSKKLIDMNIKQLRDKDILWADLVMISAMNIQQKSVELVIKQVKLLGKTIVAGGPLFTSEYENFPQVDTFILGEGEITIPQYLDDLLGEKPIKRIYLATEYADIKTSPLPDISLINFDDYESMCIQYSRGCPFKCDFCNVTALLGHNPRCKTKDQIIGELQQLYDAGWRRNIFIVDDNFISNKKELKEEILPALIEWKIGKKGCDFTTEASINLSDDELLMDLMAEAGFKDVFIGIESPNEASLVECNKKQNSKRSLIESVNKIQKKGIQVMAGFIVGFDNDAGDIFDRMIDFIQSSGIVTAMVGLLQAPAGTELHARLSKEGRILSTMSGDNADGTTNIVTRMDSKKLQLGYFKIMNSIYSPNLLYPRIKTFLSTYSHIKSKFRLKMVEAVAFLKTVFYMGLNFRESKHYWDLLGWTMKNYPNSFPVAIRMIIYGFHFRKVTALNMRSVELRSNY